MLFGTLFLWQLATFIFVPSLPITGGLDESWRQFLGYAFREGKLFGTEVVFTYGPWGFLLEPRGFPELFPYLVVGRLILSVGMVAGLSLLAMRWLQRPLWRWLWAWPVLVIADPAYLLPVLLVLAGISTERESWRSVALSLLSASVGLAANTKFTSFLLLGLMLPALLLDRATRFFGACAIVSFAAFWLLGKQSVLGLASFISSGLQVSGGYNRAMAAGDEDVMLYFGLSLLILTVPLLIMWVLLIRSAASAVGSGAVLACAFVMVKHSVIRHDPDHIFMGLTAGMVPLVLTLLPVLYGDSTRLAFFHGWRRALTVAALLTIVGAIAGNTGYIRQRLQLYKAALSSFRRNSSLRLPGTGSSPAAGPAVDVFPSDLSFAFRNRLLLRNRPVIQSYAAYTQDLSARNADFLKGAQGPDRIYYVGEPIDRRYATVEDSLIWRSMLTHYEPVGTQDDALVLGRRRNAVAASEFPILDQEVTAGHALDIPDTQGSMVWAEIRYRVHPLGRLITFLYRGQNPEVFVETSRRSQTFSLVADTAGAGFLLSPYIDGPLAFTDLYQMQHGLGLAEPVHRLTFLSSRRSSLYLSDRISVKLFRLQLSASDTALTSPEFRALVRSVVSRSRSGEPPTAPRLAIDSGEIKLYPGANSTAVTPLLKEAARLSVRFGRQHVPGSQAATGFEITWRGPEGQQKTLLTSDRPCVSGEPDWFEQQTIGLEGLKGGEFVFSTRAVGSCGGLTNFWSDISLH